MKFPGEADVAALGDHTLKVIALNQRARMLITVTIVLLSSSFFHLKINIGKKLKIVSLRYVVLLACVVSLMSNLPRALACLDAAITTN